ncbi:MAG: hypothetical protein JOY59_00285 [Candidatus Eremiobacteraeota bacterium]|nr:hypothetical protein [Candidatus Eremiobacteraeota bacterium]
MRPPSGWISVENPKSYGKVRILAMWREPGTPRIAQNLSLGIQHFSASLATYAAVTDQTLHSGPLKPTRYADVPYACTRGPARLLVYETSFFGLPLHFEQIFIKRADDVYVATYTRGIKQVQNVLAARALRGVCR